MAELFDNVWIIDDPDVQATLLRYRESYVETSKKYHQCLRDTEEALKLAQQASQNYTTALRNARDYTVPVVM